MTEPQASEEATALVDAWCLECHRDVSCRTGTGHADLKRRIGEFVDRVSRERTRQALERAANLEMVLLKAVGRIENTIANRLYGERDASDAEVEAVIASDHLLREIRALLSDGESVASEEKEE